MSERGSHAKLRRETREALIFCRGYKQFQYDVVNPLRVVTTPTLALETQAPILGR